MVETVLWIVGISLGWLVNLLMKVGNDHWDGGGPSLGWFGPSFVWLVTILGIGAVGPLDGG